MTYGKLPIAAIRTALDAYNNAAKRTYTQLPQVTWEEFVTWAEIHHALTCRYVRDGRYRYGWDEVRPWP